MKEVQVKVTKYVCENCGARHSKESSIHECHLTCKEICDKCGAYLPLIPTEIYGDTLDYVDVETQKYFVDKKYTENQWDEERYWQVADNVRKHYILMMQELNKAFADGTITEFLQRHREYD